MSKRDRLFRLARKLRKRLQPSLSVRVRLVEPGGCLGSRSRAKQVCHIRAKRFLGQTMFYRPAGKPPYFLIEINAELGWDAMADTLVHEMAHCLSWGTDSEQVDEHDEIWGMAYSRAYRACF